MDCFPVIIADLASSTKPSTCLKRSNSTLFAYLTVMLFKLSKKARVRWCPVKVSKTEEIKKKAVDNNDNDYVNKIGNPKTKKSESGIQKATLMSRIERKYCLTRTSGLFQDYLSELCGYW